MGEMQEGLQNSLLLWTTIGEDLSSSQREDLIQKSYISSRAVSDFVAGELDLESFLDIQEFCLVGTSMDEYLQVVEVNIEGLSFAELFSS